MKRFVTILVAALMLCALLTGCAGTNYRYDGNVSTTDNGYVNGTNGDMGSFYYDDANGSQGAANGTGDGSHRAPSSGRPTPRPGDTRPSK